MHSGRFWAFALIMIGGIMAFTGCDSNTTIVNTPTPVPSVRPTQAPASTGTPTPQSSAAVFVEYNNNYPAPEIVGNIGSNIENGGLSVYSDKRIYHAGNGLWRMTRDGEDEAQLVSQQYIAFLNDVGDYIYYVATHDMYVYRVRKDGTASEERLPIHGAHDLLVLGDAMYYRSAAGDHNDYTIFRSDLDGGNVQSIGIKSSSICPDGVYIYLSNLNDDGKLYRYNTITGELVKLRSDKAIQINIIDDMIYYIDANDGYKVVRIERTGAGRNVIIDAPCMSLNHERNRLIYTSTEDHYVKSLDVDTGEEEALFEVKDIHSINIAERWLFFESYPDEELDAQLYRFNLRTQEMTPNLPTTEYALIDSIDLDSQVAWVDYVEYYIDEEAVRQYALDNEISNDKAQADLGYGDDIYYIDNPKQRTVPLSIEEWTPTTLAILCPDTDMVEYNVSSIADLRILLEEKAPDQHYLFKLSVLEDRIIRIEEIFCPDLDQEKG